MVRLSAIGMLIGWRRNLVAFLFGLCATVTLPPFFVFPLVIPAFGGLLLLLNGAVSRRRMFFDGWWWGWGYYITGLYWFCIALLTDAEKFAWLIPFALFGLTAVIALYNGIIALLYSYIPRRGILPIMVFPCIWVAVEYARGHLFTGFPWNLAGYAFAASDISIQLASLVGVYGLTWFAVFAGSVPSAFSIHGISKRKAMTLVGCVYALLCVGLIWGAWRLHNAGETRYVEGVTLRLVQANIAQHHKWDPALQMEGLKTHVELTQSEGIEGITHVIWPETAVPYVVREGSRLTEMLGAVLPPQAILVTGSLRAEGMGEAQKIWNSMVAINPSGGIVGSYDKYKLVPFGEFLPFRALIPKPWTTPVGEKDFSEGVGAQTLDWGGLRGISPLICYEAIFPEVAVDKENPPAVLLNLTNDAWFGNSSGPYQHFHMSRMRAVEQGIPMIRVANTGITAVVDSYGRIMQKLELGRRGIIDTRVPKKADMY